MHPPINHPDAIVKTALDLLESHGGDFWMLAKGESMSPLIRDGDRTKLCPLQSSPEHGEILVFHDSNGVIAHRLLRLICSPEGEIFCISQGDHALSADAPIAFHQVAGRVI